MANVRCRICRKKKDDDNLLLCDGCNSGFHLYCLRPPLRSIPEGDWFCLSCKPQPSRTKPAPMSTSNRRRDRRGGEEASEASSDIEGSDDDGDSGSESASSDEEETGKRRLRSSRGKHSASKKGMTRSSSQSSLPAKASASKNRKFSGNKQKEMILCTFDIGFIPR